MSLKRPAPRLVNLEHRLFFSSFFAIGYVVTTYIQTSFKVYVEEFISQSRSNASVINLQERATQLQRVGSRTALTLVVRVVLTAPY